MRIIFMGTASFSLQVLKHLSENVDIVGICTKADKLGNRKALKVCEVKEYAQAKLASTPCFTPKSLKDEEFCEVLKALKPDFIVVAAYGKILPKGVLDIAPCINIHTSLLPKYRGASPIQAAILAGESESGVSTMLMDEGLDTGDVLEQVKVEIKDKSAEELFALFAKLGAKLALSTLLNFKNLKGVKQDSSKASFCTLIKKEEGLVEFKDCLEIYKKFLAFKPWPGVFLKNNLKLLDLFVYEEEGKNEEGVILQIEKDFIVVGCKKGKLGVKTLQSPGKKPMDARSYLNGKRLKLNERLV